MVKNFRYEIEHQVALSGFPEFPEDADWLHSQGIRAVLSLHPVPDPVQQRLIQLGIRWHPYLIEAFPAMPAGFGDAMEFIADAVSRTPPLLIHCRGGGGRSGTMLAAHLILQSVPVEDAIARSPGAEGDTQSAFLHGVSAMLDTRILHPRR